MKLVLLFVFSTALIGCKDSNVSNSNFTQSIKSVEGTTWRGVEGNNVPRQYTFLPNGVLRNTWSGVSGNDPQNNDGGTWSQNGKNIYFQFNNKHVQNNGIINDKKITGETVYATGSKTNFELNEINQANEVAFQQYQKDMKAQTDNAKIELLRNKCLEVSTVAPGSEEIVARALKTSMHSVDFIRTRQLSNGRCLIVVDTPIGQEICLVEEIIYDKATSKYIASLRNPIGNAGCGSWLGY